VPEHHVPAELRTTGSLFGSTVLAAPEPSRKARWPWVAASVVFALAITVLVIVSSSKMRTADRVVTTDAAVEQPVVTSPDAAVVVSARDTEHAEQYLEVLERALDDRRWMAAAKEAKALRAKVPTEFHVEIDKELADHSEAAGKAVARMIKQTVDAGDCEAALIAAEEFTTGWGAQAAESVAASVQPCNPIGTIQELYAAQRYRDAFTRCIAVPPLDDETKYTCVVAACAFKKRPRARDWLLKIPGTSMQRAIDECRDQHQVELRSPK
jgi:hypothetical protein